MLSSGPFLPKTTFLLCVRVFFCSFKILSLQLFCIDHKRNQKHKHLKCIITFPIILVSSSRLRKSSLPHSSYFSCFFLLIFVFSTTVAPFFLLFLYIYIYIYRKKLINILKSIFKKYFFFQLYIKHNISSFVNNNNKRILIYHVVIMKYL